MKNILISFLLLFSSNLLAENKLKLYAESNIYFIPKNEPANILEISKMNKYYGGFIEIHRDSNEIGGEWNIEIRLNENNILNILFWVKNRDQAEINKDFDLSSLSINSLSLLKTASGEIKINILPIIIKPELQPIEIGLDNFGLNHFCFNNSAMIIDDNFYIGKLMGLAQRTQIRIPEFYNIDFSLKPLRDMLPIGVLEDGIINIDVDENHILTLLNVGIGPSGYKKGGPFKVFGKISSNHLNRNKLLQSTEKNSFNDTTPRIKSIIMKANRKNIYSEAGITTSNETNSSEHLLKTIGDIFTGQNCGNN